MPYTYDITPAICFSKERLDAFKLEFKVFDALSIKRKLESEFLINITAIKYIDNSLALIACPDFAMEDDECIEDICEALEDCLKYALPTEFTIKDSRGAEIRYTHS